MPYATRTDMEHLRGASFVATLVAVDVDIDVATSAALSAAEGRIDAYLRRRYTLPLAIVPHVLTVTAIDLACYELAADHGRLTDDITARATRAEKLLRDLSSGVATLGEAEPLSGGIEPAPGQVGISSDDAASFSARERQFGRGRPAP